MGRKNEKEDDARFLELCVKESKRAKRREERGLTAFSPTHEDMRRRNEASNLAEDRKNNENGIGLKRKRK